MRAGVILRGFAMNRGAMPEAVPITCGDHAAVELREAAPRGNDADASRRM
ncbi:MAG: hypothetical protein ACREDU_06420 [Methylocella sp.]